MRTPTQDSNERCFSGVILLTYIHRQKMHPIDNMSSTDVAWYCNIRSSPHGVCQTCERGGVGIDSCLG